jgi:hypothetical protein
MTPQTTQGTTLKENGSPNSRSILQGTTLNIKNSTRHLSLLTHAGRMKKGRTEIPGGLNRRLNSPAGN